MIFWPDASRDVDARTGDPGRAKERQAGSDWDTSKLRMNDRLPSACRVAPFLRADCLYATLRPARSQFAKGDRTSCLRPRSRSRTATERRRTQTIEVDDPRPNAQFDQIPNRRRGRPNPRQRNSRRDISSIFIETNRHVRRTGRATNASSLRRSRRRHKAWKRT